jgi:hypothetical protein
MEWKTLIVGVGIGVLLMPLMLFLLLKVGLWMLKRKLTQFANSISSALTPPLEISLRPLNPVRWADPRVEPTGAQLQAQGFRSIGAYAIKELKGTNISAWIHPEEKVYGVVYEHPQVGVWCDVVSQYEDGTSCTHSSAPDSGLDQDPRNPNYKLPAQSPEVLLQAHLQTRPPHPTSLHASGFEADFVRAYRETMEWRISRGTTQAEISQVAALMGQTFEPQVLEQGFQMQQIQERAQLDELLRKHFLQKTSISAAEWDKISDRVVFVHDGLSEDELEELGFGDLPEEGTPRDRARESNARHLGTLQQPVEADVYVLPEEDEEA